MGAVNNRKSWVKRCKQDMLHQSVRFRDSCCCWISFLSFGSSLVDHSEWSICQKSSCFLSLQVRSLVGLPHYTEEHTCHLLMTWSTIRYELLFCVQNVKIEPIACTWLELYPSSLCIVVSVIVYASCCCCCCYCYCAPLFLLYSTLCPLVWSSSSSNAKDSIYKSNNIKMTFFSWNRWGLLNCTSCRIKSSWHFKGIQHVAWCLSYWTGKVKKIDI